MRTCVQCGIQLVTRGVWAAMTPAERKASGASKHRGRGLCSLCQDRARRAGTLIDHERSLGDRDIVLDEAVAQMEAGLRYANIPARLGISHCALTVMVKRARDAGDERAIRLHNHNPHARDRTPR